MPKPTKLTATALVAVSCLGLSSPPSAAQDTESRVEYAPTMLVLDGSHSMAAPDPSDGTKMDAAKDAVRTVVDVVPAEARVGFATFGTSTGTSNAEKRQGCQDVTVLREPEPIDKEAIRSAVDDLTPRGFTPIGRALQVAASALPKQGPSSVVLVSDGKDTCAPPDPCEVARTLSDTDTELVVHTVGLAVDESTREQLSCVAQATGGTYTDAPDAKSLGRVLPRVTATAVRNYEPAGTAIVGGDRHNTAPTAGTGQYLDTIGQEEKRYYAVEVEQGASAYFSATVSFPRLHDIPPGDDNNILNLRVYGRQGQDCNVFESEQMTLSSHGSALTVSTKWDGATKAKTGDADHDRCAGGGVYYFAVEWATVSRGMPARLPIELLIGIEPHATDTGPEEVLPAVTFAEPTAPATDVTGGGSFNVAGILDGSGSYTDVLQRGEFVFYRVKLDWGQGLAYRVRFGKTPGRGLENLSNIKTILYSPHRAEIEYDFSSYTGQAAVLPTNDEAIATVPVRYNNRTADDNKIQAQSVAGWYYIAVKLGPPKEGNSAAPVPLQLDITVGGQAEEGPTYAFGSTDDEKAGPFGQNPDAGARTEPDNQAVRLRETSATGGLSSFGWVLVSAGGGLLIVAVILGGVVIRRRRRAAPPRYPQPPWTA